MIVVVVVVVVVFPIPSLSGHGLRWQLELFFSDAVGVIVAATFVAAFVIYR